MNKALVVATNEYISAVTSKPFIIGVLLMPVFMGGSIVVQLLTRDQVDLSDRRVAIVDPSGSLFDVIATQAEVRNQNVIETSADGPPKQLQPKFIVERYVPQAGADEERPDVALSRRVDEQDLFAFLIIPQDVFATDSDSSTALAYHTETPSYTALPSWLEQTINAELQRVRMQEFQLSAETLAAVTRRVRMAQFGLVSVGTDGQVIDAKEENKILTFVVPFAGMMIMFMVVMTVAPTMMNNVLEEKMQKISEFLVSSVTPFQLMAGKLLGGVAVALTLSCIYLGATYALVNYFEISDRIAPSIYAWLMLFLMLALIIYGSIFSAIGAGCCEIRDAQGLMTPVMLMVIMPMLCLVPVLESPSSTFSRLVSLFPPATPMLMFLRIAIPPGPPAWEIGLGIALSILFAMACVWAGGKVFRIGILTQGQPATFRKIVQWVFSKQ